MILTTEQQPTMYIVYGVLSTKYEHFKHQLAML